MLDKLPGTEPGSFVFGVGCRVLSLPELLSIVVN